MSEPADRDDARERARAYYQGFSAAVGLRDWLAPNPRHEQLKLIVGEILAARRGLRILDVGCGTGVMSSHLARFGHVVAIDFSEPAIALARAVVSGVDFHVGELGELEDQRFDVVTLFDVLEHVPEADRPGFLGTVRERLRDGGVVIASTPHPSFTRWLRRHRPELLQVVDEEVELRDVVDVARGLELELTRYETYDVDFRGQYQLIALAPVAERGPGPVRRPALEHRMPRRRGRIAHLARRARLAARALRRGQRRMARWLLRPRGGPPVT